MRQIDKSAADQLDSERKQAHSHPIRPGQNYQRNPLVSSTTRGRGKGAAAPFPPTPNPPPTSPPSLRTTSPGPFRLTKPNTSCTIITPASLRSDCCSPSLRNAVRLASGIDVHLHRIPTMLVIFLSGLFETQTTEPNQ